MGHKLGLLRAHSDWARQLGQVRDAERSRQPHRKFFPRRKHNRLEPGPGAAEAEGRDRDAAERARQRGRVGAVRAGRLSEDDLEF